MTEIEIKDSQAAGLSPSQIRAITALLGARDVQSAAQTCEIPVKTLYRWQQEPKFKQAYEAALIDYAQTCFNRAASQLSIASSGAVDTLRAIMDDTTVAAGVRVKAAGEILSYTIRLKELQELESRIAAIEEEIEGQVIING